MAPDDLITAMMEPGFYGRSQRVEFRETHISRVFLAGNYVYKIKKRLSFSFLDYSTLEQRYHFCQEEVRLNRRLAPRVYLGVFAIRRRDGCFTIDPEPAQQFDPHAAEYAVKMRRLPDDCSLERLIAGGRATSDQMRRIALLLARFHAAAGREHSYEYGSAEAIARGVAANFEECRPFAGDEIGQREYTFIGNFNRAFIGRHREFLDRRARSGWVREGHGDLRSEHICITDGIEIIDCVEFSERLRYGDVASDLGFLLMDLDRLRAPALGQIVLRAYMAEIGDHDLSRLLNFYKCYRAMVRGKVGALKAREAEVAPAQRSKAREAARAAFAAAYHYAKAGSPALIVLCGLPASGKSTVAQALAERSGFALFNSDVVRKRMAGIAPAERAGSGWSEGIYRREFTEATYAALADAAAQNLRAGNAVIIDATYKDLDQRVRLRDLAQQAGVPIVFAECVIGEDEARRRLAARAMEPGHVSDATWETYVQLRRAFAPFDTGFGCHLRVDGTREAADNAFDIERFIADYC